MSSQTPSAPSSKPSLNGDGLASYKESRVGERSAFPEGDLGRGQGMLQGLKVLLVDDVAENRLLFAHLLKGLGAQTRQTQNGAQALQALSEEGFDLVIMDLQMPVMDGYQATSELRRQGFKAPIIALTAHARKDELQRCLDHGFSDYITKPVMTHDLILVLQRHVPPPGARGGSAAQSRQAPAPAAPMAAASVDDGDEEDPVLMAIRASLLEKLPSQASAIEAATKAAAWEDAAKLAHSLAGSAVVFGFHKIASLAATLSHDLRNPASKPAALAEQVWQLVELCAPGKPQ